MERKYEILNHDLPAMISIETRKGQPIDDKWEIENKNLQKEALEIEARPLEMKDAQRLMESASRHASCDNYYINLFINGSDSEQLAEIRNIEYIAAYVLLPDAIYIAGNNLLDKKDYKGWLNVMNSLRYVPLQKSYCYEIKTHEDYVKILSAIDEKQLMFPRTFFRMLLGHWFEWMWKVGGQIVSYEDEKCNYSKNELAQKLKVEARAVRLEWETEVYSKIDEILGLFAKFLCIDIILRWATEQPLFSTNRDNDYSRVHDGYLKKIWRILTSKGALAASIGSVENMNILLLIAENSIKKNDISCAKIVDEKIRARLLKENFTGMHGLNAVDRDRQKLLSNLLMMICPVIEDIRTYMSSVATHYHGWNMDYQQTYDEAMRESYLYCCVLRRFENPCGSQSEIVEQWKKYITLFLQIYARCDNEYISRDEMMNPFIVAIEVAEKYLNEECQVYLHKAMIDNVLSIVSLLSVFISFPIHIAGEIVEQLNKRVEVEWPSARMLMDLRGQRGLRDLIDKLIDRLEKATKDSEKR